MNKEQIKQLVDKYNKGVASEEEKALLETWYLGFNNESNPGLSPDEIDQDIRQVYHLLPGQKRIFLAWPRMAAAASVIGCLLIGWHVVFKSGQPNRQKAQNQTQVIAPGGNRAILTLANGHEIVLTDAKEGTLARQGNSLINKASNGRIVYELSASDQENEMTYNVMTTPQGGQYQLTLADGTQVWLNAASSIKYPTAFTGKQRKVEITGEAYFEVVHDKAKPFLVESNGQQVEVLGTHFNVNTYADEPVGKTTLLEGSIKVSSNGQTAMLKPGQQAQIKKNTPIEINSHADTEEATAWKNGLFVFNHADIRTVMRQFARWYDVVVDYEGNIPDDRFSGEIHRNLTASQALEILSFSKIHFRIENLSGKKTMVIIP